MAYAFRVTGSTYCLVEATPSELARKLGRRGQPLQDGELIGVTGSEAHRWVRRGGLHETGLWLDGNRIRHARATA